MEKMEEKVQEIKYRGPFELSSDTRILYNVLEKTLIKESREIATYKELTASIGRSVRGEARGLLGTARKLLENQHMVLLETVRNEGVKLTDNYEGAADKTRSHVRRTVRRAAKRVGRAINGKEITPMLAAKLSSMSALELLARPSLPKKLVTYLEQKKLKEISAAETLKLFGPENKNS